MKFLKGILLTLFILLLEGSSFALLILIPLGNALDKENIKNIVLKMNSEELKDASFFSENNLSFVEDGKQNESDEILMKLIESAEIKELLADISGNMMEYITTGKKQEFLTKEELKKLVENAIATLNKQNEYQISNDEKEEILNTVDENASYYLEEISNINTLNENLSDEAKSGLSILRFLLSTKLKMGLLITFVLSFLGVLAIRWKDQKWIKINAVTILVASVTSLMITILFKIMNEFIFKSDVIYLFRILDKFIQQSFFITFVSLFLMIIVLIIYHLFFGKKKELTTMTG